MAPGTNAALIVDDDSVAALSLAKLLKLRLPDSQFHAATNIDRAQTLVTETRPQAVILDLHLEPGRGVESGFSLLQKLIALDPSQRIIVLTGHGSIEHGVRALSAGAANFLEKPADLPHLAALVRDAITQSNLRRSFERLTLERNSELSSVVCGSSPAMQSVREALLQFACTSQSVLILGETGTGKGLCARAIHAFGKRRHANFVRYQPTFSTPDLVNSDLFGHVSGAFTGAQSNRNGLIHQASGGTLFLDELEELPLETQVALLGVLQDKTIRPVGSNSEIAVDFRLICASNGNITAARMEKKLREDFFHRVSHAIIELPPLRNRAEDIPELCQAALQHFRDRELCNCHGISDAVLSALQQHSWPGNVRELQSVIESAAYQAMRCGRQIIEIGDVRVGSVKAAPSPMSFHELVEAFKANLLNKALVSCRGNQTEAARQLGLDRSSFRRIMKRCR